jgi:hypothetical protein
VLAVHVPHSTCKYVTQQNHKAPQHKRHTVMCDAPGLVRPPNLAGLLLQELRWTHPLLAHPGRAIGSDTGWAATGHTS